MSRLSAFWESEENQKKYGFSYENNSIYYDGDFNELLEIAFKWAGYTKVEDNPERTDPRPLLEIAMGEECNLVMRNSGEVIDANVDGEGTEPNFYIRFSHNGEEIVIRFNMRFPELYPNNKAYPFRFSMESLSAINSFFEQRYGEFAARWNSIHPENKVELNRLPNYRAINRL